MERRRLGWLFLYCKCIFSLCVLLCLPVRFTYRLHVLQNTGYRIQIGNIGTKVFQKTPQNYEITCCENLSTLALFETKYLREVRFGSGGFWILKANINYDSYVNFLHSWGQDIQILSTGNFSVVLFLFGASCRAYNYQTKFKTAENAQHGKVLNFSDVMFYRKEKRIA